MDRQGSGSITPQKWADIVRDFGTMEPTPATPYRPSIYCVTICMKGGRVESYYVPYDKGREGGPYRFIPDYLLEFRKRSGPP